MKQALAISGPGWGPASGGPAKQLVVLLHGWGADGNDLISLAPYWAQLLPEAAFVSPHAPFDNDMGPGRQWFSLAEHSSERMIAGIRLVEPILNAFIDEKLERFTLSPSQLGLVGFSQGTMMALFVAPRRPEPIGALLGYSGALMGEGLLADEVRSRPPITLIHGALDDVVPCGALEHATKHLKAAGFSVTSHLAQDLGHGIDPDGISIGGRFLAEHLAAKS